MKVKILYCFVYLIIVALFTSCNKQKANPIATVNNYFEARTQGNFNALKKQVSDSITLISGDFIMPYSRESLYQQYKWDSVFQSKYNILKAVETNEKVIATVSQNCIRNAFLENNPLVYQLEISFKNGKIEKIKDLDYIDVNWNIWTSKKDSLVNWVAKNHPKLDGFVNDMSMMGAINYVKAIELYQKKN
ncbi:hypothetical protein [Winogradskyella jejuensis]|uniref:Nuclear transport factor 2 family protein n=1 Tax=Winogradskyella jejuensis TaxID=1089305 RepID=A0A1M5MS28_9FLAO|nr:hypothetical protein [Winogradskyella jejuensis]SHG79872.1 hypothetical protein SAMN05444148_0973 [Winogradskyella jejuensis]